MSIKALPNSGRLTKDGELFPTNENNRKELKYITGQPIGSARHALDTIAMGYTYREEAAVVGADSDNTIIKLTTHGAKKGDLIQFLSTANNIEEEFVTVDEVIDANTFRLSAILSDNLTPGDTFNILRPQIQRFDATGAQLVSVSPSPISFNRDGVTEEVTEDTNTPANNIPLPVKLTGVTGDVNIIAGDISVQLSDQGANYDRTRIGDGTNQLGITANSEAQVHDADAFAQLKDINKNTEVLAADLFSLEAKVATETTLAAILADTATMDSNLASLAAVDFATQTTLAAVDSKLGTLIAVDFATEDTLSDILADTATMDTNIAAINTKVATETTLAAVNTAVGGIADASVTNPASSGSVIAFLKGAVSLITSLISKFPASLGQKTSANSLSVTVASDQTPLVTQPGGGSAINVETKTGVTSLADATFSAPPGAFAFYLTCGLDGDGIRWSSFGDVTVSAGAILLPGATTPVMPFGGDIDIIALDGNSEATIVYFMK